MSFVKKLNGKRPLGVYFESWSSQWTSSAANMDLCKIDSSINLVFLAFAQPNCSYTKGSLNFTGTGLSFSSDFSIVKDAIQILKSKGTIVMLSVGGATYSYDGFNPNNVIALANDLGVDGIDIDWEPSGGASESNALGDIIGKLRQNYNGLLSMAAFSVGAYGQGEFTNSQPASQNTGMCIKGLKSNGHQLDFIAIMSYDAGNIYNPIEAFKSYRSLYKGPLLIGAEVPQEAWGGHVLSISEIQSFANFILTEPTPGNGIFVWSYRKQGYPSAIDIISTASKIFKNTNTPTQQPAQQPVKQPSQQPVKQQPAQQPVKQPAQQPVKQQPAQQSEWKTNISYSIGQLVSYNKIIYKCIQNHTSISTWTPDCAISLWLKL